MVRVDGALQSQVSDLAGEQEALKRAHAAQLAALQQDRQQREAALMARSRHCMRAFTRRRPR